MAVMSNHVCRQATGPLNADVVIPGSKSLTNRALVAAALADGVSVLTNVLLAEDTLLMIEALRSLGVAVTVDERGCAAEVSGCRGHLPESEVELFCGNSGTCMRFLTALAALGEGRYRLDGVARMRKRPVGALASALQSLGAGIEYADQEGFCPLTVHAHGIRGGTVEFDSPQSSQMVSALLLVAPYARRDVFIEVRGTLPSRPYLRMTTGVMARFGVEILADGTTGATRIVVEAPRRYQATSMTIEPDASNAMYFLAAAAVAGGRVTVRALGSESLQGDVEFVSLLSRMGCAVRRDADSITVQGPPAGTPLRGIDVDLNDMPDMVPTLAVLALFAEGRTTIRNVANLRVKESDRLAALRFELTKVGAVVEESADGLSVAPPRRLVAAEIDTYDDHRMAMSFALVGLRCPGLVIRDPECCSKTYPGFFRQFDALLDSTK